jgi:hypothetical protein
MFGYFVSLGAAFRRVALYAVNPFHAACNRGFA